MTDCPKCTNEMDEITVCSVCDFTICVFCAEKENSGWTYDEYLAHPNHRSGDVCPKCSDPKQGGKE